MAKLQLSDSALEKIVEALVRQYDEQHYGITNEKITVTLIEKPSEEMSPEKVG